MISRSFFLPLVGKGQLFKNRFPSSWPSAYHRIDGFPKRFPRPSGAITRPSGAIIMEVETTLIERKIILEGPMFHFHDYGRKCNLPTHVFFMCSSLFDFERPLFLTGVARYQLHRKKPSMIGGGLSFFGGLMMGPSCLLGHLLQHFHCRVCLLHVIWFWDQKRLQP